MAPGPRATRRTRVDAVANRARILAAARTVFAEHGRGASLNAVAKEAGVGSATLYRHFPSLQALVVDLIGDDVSRLCARGRQLLGEPDADAALRRWLGAFAAHASSMHGLVATQLAAPVPPEAANPLAACHDAIVSTGAELLERARREGTAAPHADMRDLLRLATAIAWASQQAPEDRTLLERLLTIAFGPTVDE